MITACYLWTSAPRHSRFVLYCLGRICPYGNGFIIVPSFSLFPIDVWQFASLIDPFVTVSTGSGCPSVYYG
jgi:hypothetical protein